MGTIIYDQTARVSAWVAAKMGRTVAFAGHYAMGLERNGDMVAGIVMDNFNGRNAFPHIAIERPGKDLILLLRAFCHYAFHLCGLKRLTAFVDASNDKVLAFDRHIGFVDEFVMPDGAPDGELIVLVMRRETCRWIEHEQQ